MSEDFDKRAKKFQEELHELAVKHSIVLMPAIQLRDVEETEEKIKK